MIIIFFTGCVTSSKVLHKKNYVFNDNGQRKMILTFQNDSNCTLKNRYNYEKIEDNELLIKCLYRIINHQVILVNRDNFIDTVGKGYFYFPNIENFDSSNMLSGNIVFIGPNYSTDKERYAKVPYVDRDTLIIHKRKLLWIKKDNENKVVGYYVFK
jgi:hypothetical protein